MIFTLSVLLALASELAAAPAKTAAQADSLVGLVLDSATSTPIRQAQVRLVPDTVSAFAGRGMHEAQTDEAGRFAIANVPDGRYVLTVRRIGFRAQRDRITLAVNAPRQPMTLRLAAMSVTLGGSGTDSILVARTRLMRDRWGCTPPSPGLLASARREWWRMLSPASATSITTSGALRVAVQRLAQDDSLERALRHESDRETCRRAGAVYDSVAGAERPDFLVFRLGGFHLVQNGERGDARVILDPGLRHVGTYIVP